YCHSHVLARENTGLVTDTAIIVIMVATGKRRIKMLYPVQRLVGPTWLFIVTLFLSLLLITSYVLAQEDENAAGNGLRITPVRQELTLGPGQNDSYTIEVTNVTTAPTTVTAIVNDFESDNE